MRFWTRFVWLLTALNLAQIVCSTLLQAKRDRKCLKSSIPKGKTTLTLFKPASLALASSRLAQLITSNCCQASCRRSTGCSLRTSRTKKVVFTLALIMPFQHLESVSTTTETKSQHRLLINSWVLSLLRLTQWRGKQRILASSSKS